MCSQVNLPWYSKFSFSGLYWSRPIQNSTENVLPFWHYSGSIIYIYLSFIYSSLWKGLQISNCSVTLGTDFMIDLHMISVDELNNVLNVSPWKIFLWRMSVDIKHHFHHTRWRFLWDDFTSICFHQFTGWHCHDESEFYWDCWVQDLPWKDRCFFTIANETNKKE